MLHCPRAETLLWGQVRPDYALIEDGVLGLLDAHLIAGSGYGALIRAVAADGRRVLALGVDSAARLEGPTRCSHCSSRTPTCAAWRWYAMARRWA